MKIGKIDIIDPAFHAAAAAGFVLFGSLFGSAVFAFIVSTMFWFVREVLQDYEKGHSLPNIWPLRFSTQKWAEFIAPAVSGFIVMVVTA